jgi:GT2 family glycosyltransferase
MTTVRGADAGSVASSATAVTVASRWRLGSTARLTLPGVPSSVAVVVPTYNRADLVGQCVESVLRQTVPPAEIVVVDDCSTDETAKVLGEFGDRITVVRNHENLERGASRNRGAAATSSAFLAFVDSDDLWEPRKLERQLERTPADGSSVSGIRNIDATGGWLGAGWSVPPSEAWDRLPIENLYAGSGSSVLVARSLFDHVGGYPEDRALQGSEDWLFLLRLQRAGASMPVIVPEPLVRCRVHAGNSTGSAVALARSMWGAAVEADQPGEASRTRRRRRARVACVVAQNFARERDWLESARWVRRSVAQGLAGEAARTVVSTGRSGLRSLARGG